MSTHLHTLFTGSAVESLLLPASLLNQFADELAELRAFAARDYVCSDEFGPPALPAKPPKCPATRHCNHRRRELPDYYTTDVTSIEPSKLATGESALVTRRQCYDRILWEQARRRFRRRNRERRADVA